MARVWHEGQHALRTVPGLREERCATHSWPVMTEEEAIAFGLDRRDRTRAWHMLRLLPRQLQWAVVEAGLLDAMPESAVNTLQTTHAAAISRTRLVQSARMAMGMPRVA